MRERLLSSGDRISIVGGAIRNTGTIKVHGAHGVLPGNTDIYTGQSTGTAKVVLGKPNPGFTHEESCSKATN